MKQTLTRYMSKVKIPLLCGLMIAVCQSNASETSEEKSPEPPPEHSLKLNIDFSSDIPDSITIEEGKKRARPVIDALLSDNPNKKRAALQLIASCFRSRMGGGEKKYKMIDRAITLWVINASQPSAPKPDRDAFVNAVGTAIAFYEKDNKEPARLALAMFLDLELAPNSADNSESLLRKWQATDRYKKLTASSQESEK